MKTNTLVIVFLAILSLSLHASEKPNIVFILADDMGWSDVGYNGQPFYETPHIDALAKDGMIFNRAYAGGPNCMPMRACLMSGMYTPRTHMWTPGGLSKGDVKNMKLLVPARGGQENIDGFPSKLALNADVVSLAEVLKPAGYKTARFGKWHLGPDTQGFDVSDPSGKGGKIGSRFYGNIDVHEWLTDASVAFIKENKDSPFFVYLSHWDVHGPTRARKERVEKYKNKLASGQYDRQWNVTYAAMMEAFDWSVGKVCQALKDEGLYENTLVIFSSDNGGTGATTTKPLKGSKGSLYEGGVRVPTCMTWPNVIKSGSACDTPITSVDFLPTFAELAGAALPKSQPVDGTSIVPLLKGEEIAERSIFWHYPMYLQGQGEGLVHPVVGTDTLYWRGVPASMIMKGDWKLIHRFEQEDTLLYNVKEDIGEQNECSAKHPEKAAELFKQLKQWQSDTKATIPDKPNPKFGG